MADGAALLAICGGYQSLGVSYRTGHDRTVRGPGLFDIRTVAGARRLVGPVVGHLTDPSITTIRDTVIGFENHSGRTRLAASARPLATIEIGSGNNGRERSIGRGQPRPAGVVLESDDRVTDRRDRGVREVADDGAHQAASARDGPDIEQAGPADGPVVSRPVAHAEALVAAADRQQGRPISHAPDQAIPQPKQGRLDRNLIAILSAADHEEVRVRDDMAVPEDAIKLDGDAAPFGPDDEGSDVARVAIHAEQVREEMGDPEAPIRSSGDGAQALDGIRWPRCHLGNAGASPRRSRIFRIPSSVV